MAIPKYESMMLPILELAADGNEHSMKEATRHIGEYFNLSDEERTRIHEKSGQRVIANRVGWARTFLKKAEFVEYPRPAHFKILPRGSDFLSKNPKKLDVSDLKKYPEFEKNWNTEKKKKRTETVHEVEDQTPEEKMETGFEEISANLEGEILEQIMSCSPHFFEKLVIDVLLSMGYGGSLKDAGEALGRTGDGGIDGIIKEDKLGLDTIYIQAKRWEGTVGRPEIQKFAGALQGNRAKKGVFITTSCYSADAQEYVKNIDVKIILIDGEQLAQLMVDHDVGVSRVSTYIVKRIDTDYFAEE